MVRAKWVVCTVLLTALCPEVGHGTSLEEDLIDLTKVSLDTEAGHKAHFTGPSTEKFGASIAALSASASDVPAIGSAPGFTYRYDRDLGAFQRERGNLGTLFIDRATTVGKNAFELGMSYLHVNFQSLEGEDLEGFSDTLVHQDLNEEDEFEQDEILLQFTDFNLVTDEFQFFLTYGLTERWDFNVLVPVLITRLDATVRKSFVSQALDDNGDPIHTFQGGGSQEIASVDDSKTGVGDVLIRTKYRAVDDWHGLALAGTLGFRLPTGNQDNFQGGGATVVSPGLVGSRSFGRMSLHGGLAFDLDAHNVDGSRVRYGLGGSVGLVRRLTLFAEFFGSSGLADEDISYTVREYDEDIQDTVSREETTTLRTDLFDFAGGVKVNVFGDAVLFAGAAVPITDDGLRASVIPVAGFEVTF